MFAAETLMGKPFQSELLSLAQTYEWAVERDLDPLSKLREELANRSLYSWAESSPVDGDGFLATTNLTCSPDGRWVVYTTYRQDAIELWVLDVEKRQSHQITSGGAVNIEPRFSPDGMFYDLDRHRCHRDPLRGFSGGR